MSPKAKTKAPEKKAKADKKTVERIEHAGLLDVRELTTHFKLGAGDVKAVTYNDMRIEDCDCGVCTVQVVVDM